MNDEDQEDLLIHVSESEDSSAESEAYLETGRVIPFVQQNDNIVYEEVKCCNKNRIEFFCSGTLLVIASTFLLVILPLYSDAVNVVSDVYTLVLFTSVVSSMILLVLTGLSGRANVCKSTLTQRFNPPFRLSLLLQAGVAQGIGGLLVLFALDSKKVLCHLQDPIKGVSLVFALMFYFLCSNKLMGIQRIFCTTTIVVGLFVCLDYGLCDEFRCRGWERERSEDDAGLWKRAVHFLAGSAYIVGLAMWTFHFSLVERGLASLQLGNLLFKRPHQTSSLSTVSRIVSRQDGCVENSVPLLSSAQAQNQNTTPNSDTVKQQQVNSSVSTSVPPEAPSKPSALVLASWLHVVSVTVVLLFCWADMLPYVGKASSWVQLANLTHRGLMCHVGVAVAPINEQTADCGLLPVLGWLFAAFLAILSVSASNVLILSQSAVVTVALMTCALPLGNIFWSFFRLPPASAGALEWWPSLTAELVCTFVGFPIVGAGVYLLCRSQLVDSGPPREPCCTLRFHQRSCQKRSCATT